MAPGGDRRPYCSGWPNPGGRSLIFMSLSESIAMQALPPRGLEARAVFDIHQIVANPER